MSERSHLRLQSGTITARYKWAGGGGGPFKTPVRDRLPHAQKLRSELIKAAGEGQEARREQGLFTRAKAYVYTFQSDPNHDLALESLERDQFGIELMSVATRGGVMFATVRVPEGQLKRFLKLIDDYEKKETKKKHRPRNQPLIESIASIRLAVVSDLWQDTAAFPGPEETIWWEVWVPSGPGGAKATYNRFRELAEAAGLRLTEQYISFPERVVTLAWGSQRQLSSSLDLLAEVAELRRATELAGEYVKLSPVHQQEFIDDAVSRIVPPPASAPAVCLLDTGVNRGHPLLSVGLDEADAQALRPAWGSADHHRYQHGTTMAGIALYGCLTNVLNSSGPFRLRHRLESVKLLPPVGRNEPDVYGAVTQEAVARAEVQAPNRNRAICLTLTSDSQDVGYPSSWSAAIDQLCTGELDGTRRLLFVAAGNIVEGFGSESYCYHTTNCGSGGIEDPAQSWNALTVGAITEKVFIQDPEFQDWQPLAESGDLSPRSRTSLAWPEETHAGWPLKPDIVMEGGNYAKRGSEVSSLDDLALLTTVVDPTGRRLDTTCDTSPATAAAARMAAIIWSYYPHLWPETIRALMVHSASWTPPMFARFPENTKTAVQERLRCYGYGVPSLKRALWSAENSVTLVYEGELQPYHKPGSEVETKEMHIHELPWPKEILDGLGETDVTMRVTLSYFVEPSPGRRGWTTRHRFASHGLRFDVIRPLEGVEDFRKRISRTEWEDSKKRPSNIGDTRNWVIGDNGRTHGSLHADWWQGTASELARCNRIAVFPVTGWWRERDQLDRWGKKARYSLVVSIETPRVDVDLYTPIATETIVTTEIEL